MHRRRGTGRVPVNYALVGGTKQSDVHAHPPRGFVAGEFVTRIGSGEHRFRSAADLLMHWGVQRRMEMRVEAVTVGDDFDVADDGVPKQAAPAKRAAKSSGPTFQLARVTPGTEATLIQQLMGMRLRIPVRVVYVINEADRVGFAIGTLEGSPIAGEMLWYITRDDLDRVWYSVRHFSRVSRWWMRPFAPVAIRRFERAIARSARALSPGTRTRKR